MNKVTMIDLAAEIEKYGEESFQDFEGFSSAEEQELIINEIKKCSKSFLYKEDLEYIQTLCDVVLIKILQDLQEGEFDVHYCTEKVLDYMVIFNDMLSCRYLLKSGINWIKEIDNV